MALSTRIRLDEMVPRSGPAHEDLLVPANRPGGGEEIGGIEVLVDEADPRVFRVVEIPVGDRVDAGIRAP